MKLAFVTTYDFAIPGGVRNHIIELAREFTDQGHRVFIIAPSSQSNSQTHINNFIKIAHFPSASKTGFIPPHLLLNLGVIKRLHSILNSHEFDLIHIHEPLLPPLCLSALFHKNTPLFATFHTYYEKGQPMYRLFQPIFTKYLNRLQGRIAVSQSAKTYIEHYFPYDYKVIPNGVNIEKFSSPVLPLAELTPGYFNLLFVGHAQFKRKGLRYMLEAYQILKKEYPTLRLIVAGTQWSGRKLNHTYLDDILYLGTISDSKLIALYQSCDIFCAPSTGNESFGMVLTEALASEIPIVTTSIDGYANVVQDGYNALLVPPKDSAALAGAIQRLIDSPALRQQLIEQGKNSVQRFAWKNVAKDIMNYYIWSLDRIACKKPHAILSK